MKDSHSNMRHKDGQEKITQKWKYERPNIFHDDSLIWGLWPCDTLFTHMQHMLIIATEKISWQIIEMHQDNLSIRGLDKSSKVGTGHGSQHLGSVIGLGNFKTSVSVSVIR